MVTRKHKECELCGKILPCSFCRCDACRNMIYDNTEASEDYYREGRWLCKECIKMGGE